MDAADIVCILPPHVYALCCYKLSFRLRMIANPFTTKKSMTFPKFRVSIAFDTFAIKRLNWKVFLIAALGGFIISLLQTLGVVRLSSTLISPIPTVVTTDVFTSVKPLLSRVKNTYTLADKTSLIGSAFASGSYDKAKAYVVVEYDSGRILASHNAKTRLPIASLTKIMTAVVALDLTTPSSRFRVSRKSTTVIPTRIGVVAGQSLTVAELLHALLLTSANDVADVIQEGIDGVYKSDVFIRAMNAKAQFLGLTNTSFDNPQGFDGQTNYSTASDLAVLTHYALTNYPLIASIVGKEYQFLPADKFHKKYDLYNWNGLIGVYEGIQGVKIGNTGKAGKTTIVLSARKDKKVLAVLLGAPGIIERDLWAGQLLDMGFLEYDMLPIRINKTRLMKKYQTWIDPHANSL